MRLLKHYILLFYIYSYFLSKRFLLKLSMIGIRIGHFVSIYCYALLISNLLFSFLFCVFRIYTVYFKNLPISNNFLDLSYGIATFLDILFFCFCPALFVFLYLFKKSKKFFATFFEKSKYISRLFIYIGKLEYNHCKELSSGFKIFVCVIIFYGFSISYFSHLNCYLYLSIGKCLIYMYISFRTAFSSQYNLLIKGEFQEFDKLYTKLSQKDVTWNRIIFLNIYFLVLFLIMCLKEEHVLIF